MASVLLSVAGGAIGGAIGGPIGAALGQALGGLAGSAIDARIINALTPAQQQTGPRLTTTDISTSTEGSTINKTFGRARQSGQIIWATRFEEQISTETTGGKGASSPAVTTTTYSYYANFAIGLVEGPITGIGRIWADGEEIDQAKFNFRVYLGTETQDADPLIEAKEGTGNAPAYRGLAYVVFERLAIANWGNRIPQISVEIYRATGAVETKLNGVALIPGNEFGFDPGVVKVDGTQGGEALNRHTLVAESDFAASIDALQMLCPNLSSVLLVVNWFGDDLRCGDCAVRPMVDNTDKQTTPYNWAVAGLTRSTALMVSTIDGSAAYGGTPSDASVIAAIQNLNTRGIAVTFLPFIEMDIADGNTLPDPYSDNAATAGQAVYPWRGRITVSPATGFAGTVDKSATAATQIAAFMGTAAAAHFSGSGTTVTYSGPAEWRYRRFILHNAELAKLAGGVEAFLIGSEMIGLSQVRSNATTYPFVTALKSLAGEARTILRAGVKIGYAADWSEWNTHRPDDGTGDVLFNLDPLWSDSNIDFVGIDNYMPLADWREGTDHLDFSASGPTTTYDAAYLDANIAGGEYFDWYYADATARDAQTRTAIADGDPANEPWVFRQKDIHGWWANAHHDRPGGVRSGSATGWTAQGKPIRFIEFGCPAVDKGANQPNVFPDPKSSEGAYPYYSTNARDDAMQRAFLAALIDHFAAIANNPVSSVYGGSMVDLAHSHAWSWDVRPWPSFPLDTDWGDYANWDTGHWLSGRLGAAPARDVLAAILEDAEFSDYAIEPMPGVVDGVTIGNLTTARALLESLQPAFQFDAIESEGVIKIIARLGRPVIATLDYDDLVAGENGPSLKRTRAQETELPDAIKISFGDPARDDQSAGVEARRSTGSSLRTSSYSPPVVMAENVARAIAETELHAAWVGRERVSFSLPPSRIALDPGDIIGFAPANRPWRIGDIADAEARDIEGFEVDPLAYAPFDLPKSATRQTAKVTYLNALPVIIDGPLLEDTDSDYAGYVSGVLSPFGSGMALYRSPSTSNYVFDTLLTLPGTIGITTADFYKTSYPMLWDRANSLYVDMVRGTLSSADEGDVLNGANTMLIENQDGEWEVLRFATATINGSYSYILSDLLRGLKGTEHAMRDPVPAGARVIVYNAAIVQTSIPSSLIGFSLNWKSGPASEDIGSSAYTSLTATLAGKGRRPLSPVHFKGARDSGSGDWSLSWIRRTRIGGENDWRDGVTDVPLGEDSEAYRLQILDGPGGTVVRSIDLSSSPYAYSAADQAIDFGSAVTSFSARVAQLSTTYGAGIFNEQVIS